jgi:hypothetical protein
VSSSWNASRVSVFQLQDLSGTRHATTGQPTRLAPQIFIFRMTLALKGSSFLSSTRMRLVVSNKRRAITLKSGQLWRCSQREIFLHCYLTSDISYFLQSLLQHLRPASVQFIFFSSTYLCCLHNLHQRLHFTVYTSKSD